MTVFRGALASSIVMDAAVERVDARIDVKCQLFRPGPLRQMRPAHSDLCSPMRATLMDRLFDQCCGPVLTLKKTTRLRGPRRVQSHRNWLRPQDGGDTSAVQNPSLRPCADRRSTFGFSRSAAATMRRGGGSIPDFQCRISGIATRSKYRWTNPNSAQRATTAPRATSIRTPVKPIFPPPDFLFLCT